ncbi:MAG: hypothetical protein AB7R40_06060 [Nitrospiraceae bacterium]
MNVSPAVEASPPGVFLSTAQDGVGLHVRDICILFGLGAIAVLFSYRASGLIAFNVWDVWFEASVPRIYSNMVAMDSDQSRSNLHPLFSLLVYPPTAFFRKGLGLDPVVAVRVMVACVAGVWVSLLYLLLRTIDCRRLDAVLLTLLALSSAAAIFWLPIPETYPFGSCSLLLALLLMNTVPRTSFWWYVAINVASLSVTVTNWMAGLAATLVNQGMKRSLQVGVAAVVFVVLASGMQKVVFPSVKLAFGDSRHETKYLLMPEAGGPVTILRSLLFHSMIMPEIFLVNNKDSLLEAGTTTVDLGKKMTTQPSPLGTGTSWTWIAVVMWSLLLCLGIGALLTLPGQAPFRLVLGLLIGGQVLLHLLYGEESFLYAIHLAPLLILTVGLSTLTAARPIVLGLVAILIVTMGANNLHQFKQAVEWQDDLRQQYRQATVSKTLEIVPAP